MPEINLVIIRKSPNLLYDIHYCVGVQNVGVVWVSKIFLMVLTLPIVYPLIISMGYDPIWWGVINVVIMIRQCL